MTTNPRSFLSLLTGSFATPAAENPTVAMIEAAFRAMGLDWRYLNSEVAPGRPRRRRPRRPGDGLARLQLHHPAQGRRRSRTSTGSASPRRSSARSTASSAATASCIGENTDGKGFLQSLRERRRPGRQAARPVRRRRRGAGDRRRDCALAGAAPHHGRQPRRRARRASWSRCSTSGRRRDAEFVAWDGDYAVPEGDRPGRQRHLDRPVPRRGRAARSTLDTLRPRHDRLRRDPQPAADPAGARRRGAGLHRPRRPGHAGQPGRHRHPPLDGHRPRPGGDAPRGRGDLRV